MRLKLVSPVVGVSLLAGGFAAMMAAPSQAAPVKLYFHSVNGGYLDDWAASPAGFPADTAPAGSTLDAKAPTSTTDATAQSTSTEYVAGLPNQPSFHLPFEGDVTSMCVDVWVQSSMHAGVPDLAVWTTFNTPTSSLDMEDATAPHASGIFRITKLVKPDGAAKLTIPKDSELVIGGNVITDPMWTLVYDSVAHPSSITINPTECKGAPIVVPSGTATPTATPSGTATPSASATATPSGSATATPTATPSGTATPSATPTVAPTTPPPPAQETGLDYTGATAGRYSDSVPVSARATLPDGSPVPTGSIEFALGSRKVAFPIKADGVASGRMPVLAGAGEQILTVRYVANSAYLGSARQVPFTVSRMPTKCAISRTTVSGGKYVVTATLRDAAGRAVVGQPVLFSFNGTTHHSVKTDRNGRAALTVPARRGTYGIALRTNAGYTGCAASFRV